MFERLLHVHDVVATLHAANLCMVVGHAGVGPMRPSPPCSLCRAHHRPRSQDWQAYTRCALAHA
eukprot:8948089-Alexandrium_andersonii.AAC.1